MEANFHVLRRKVGMAERLSLPTAAMRGRRQLLLSVWTGAGLHLGRRATIPGDSGRASGEAALAQGRQGKFCTATPLLLLFCFSVAPLVVTDRFLQGDRELVIKGEDGRLYHWILPSFFQLLKDLAHEGREFAVVFRTFGSDLPRVLRVVQKALNDGAHPLFPDLPDLKVKYHRDEGAPWWRADSLHPYS